MKTLGAGTPKNVFRSTGGLSQISQNSYAGAMPGSMYNQILVSFFYFDRLYGGTPILVWN